MLRNQSPQQSPSPTVMMPSQSMPNVKPIGPPNVANTNSITTTNTSTTTPTTPNEPTKTTWGANTTGKTLAEALKGTELNCK